MQVRPTYPPQWLACCLAILLFVQPIKAAAQTSADELPIKISAQKIQIGKEVRVVENDGTVILGSLQVASAANLIIEDKHGTLVPIAYTAARSIEVVKLSKSAKILIVCAAAGVALVIIGLTLHDRAKFPN